MVGVAKIAVANVAQKVSSTSPNFTCSVDNTVSLGCSPSFVICAGSIAYVFSCDNNLVFDQAKNFVIKFLIFFSLYIARMEFVYD